MNLFFKENFEFSSLLMILAGLALLLWPGGSLLLLCRIGGVVLIIFGAFFLYHHLILKECTISVRLAADLFWLILGLFLVFRPNATVSMVPILIGLAIIYSGGAKIYEAFQLRSYGSTHFVFSLIFAILSIGFALILMLYPFSSISIMVRAVGILLIINGVTRKWTPF